MSANEWRNLETAADVVAALNAGEDVWENWTGSDYSRVTEKDGEDADPEYIEIWIKAGMQYRARAALSAEPGAQS